MNAEVARAMAAYNRWMNERLYAVCAELTDQERKRDRRVFFGSIHGVLNHLLLADRIWLGRFEDRPYPARSLDQEVHAEFDALTAARAETDRNILDWASGLDQTRLESTLHYVSMVDPAPRSCPLWIAVTHCFNHQTHHRGQLTALLAQCGRDYGVTDFIGMPGVMTRPASAPGGTG